MNKAQAKSRAALRVYCIKEMCMQCKNQDEWEVNECKNNECPLFPVKYSVNMRKVNDEERNAIRIDVLDQLDYL